MSQEILKMTVGELLQVLLENGSESLNATFFNHENRPILALALSIDGRAGALHKWCEKYQKTGCPCVGGGDASNS